MSQKDYYIARKSQSLPVSATGQLFPDELQRALSLIFDAYRKSAERREAPSAEPHGSESGHKTISSLSRQHQNIGILGRRGAGKTSFLLTVLKLLEPGAESDDFRAEYAKRGILGDDASEWTKLASKVALAGLIEPALMEHGDHVVATAYANILERVRERVLVTIWRHLALPRDP